jgi:hypothetical protein
MQRNNCLVRLTPITFNEGHGIAGSDELATRVEPAQWRHASQRLDQPRSGVHTRHGGLLKAYRDRFVQAPENGERVVIDGRCEEACTLAVGILPPGRVCVTPQAVLEFQRPWTPPPGFTGGRITEVDKVPSPRADQWMMNIYPPALRQWINQHGGLTPKVLHLRGKELAAIVPKC